VLRQVTSAIRIDAATTLDEVKALLATCGLPTQDIREDAVFVVARSDVQLCGTAGMEPFGTVGLLRSVAVQPAWRAQGIARALCDEISQRARAMGVRRLFLLTTDAHALFRRAGFATIERDSLPAEIRATAQFRELCPASAVAMARDL
jgi:amino-acid N-acetyltransferase